MSKPNILWIYCDELRTDALGCYGNRHFTPRTPHIDRIAADGVRFENSFCNSPVCVPSRASVKTGLYPEDLGVYHNDAYAPEFTMREIPVTFPEVFARHGYRTANIGKEHIPHQMQPWQYSNRDGSSNKKLAAGMDASMGLVRPPGMKNILGGRFPADRPYPPEQVTENALAWLGQAQEPFMLRVSYLQPHTPVVTPAPFDTMYMNEKFPDMRLSNRGLSAFERRIAEIPGTYQMSERDIFLTQAYYYGLVSWVDVQVGRLMDALRKQGLEENTIVVFDSDHGRSLGEFGRLQKQTFGPESHRVPRLISWKGTLAGGQVRRDLNESLDLARTLFALTGIAAPEQFKGRDLFSEPAPDKVYATIGYGLPASRAFPHIGIGEYYDGHGWPRRACVRTSRFRLDKNVRLDGRRPTAAEEDIFLADWQADPLECLNLAGDPRYSEVQTELNAALEQHLGGAVPEYPPEMLILLPGMEG